MSSTYQIIRGTIILALIVGVVGWILFRWLKRSKDDPVALIIKWVVTVPVLFLAFMSVDLFGPLGPFVIVFCAFIFSVLWTPNLVSWFLKPLTSAIDGGDIPPDPKPLYSIAQSKRKKGKYDEAMAEIRKQLGKFPNDVEGQLMLAEIQAENLNDLVGAQTTIQRLCNQPDHAPRNIALALNSLADWHLKYAQDREAARQTLEKIIERLPNSEFSVLAAQRIAHIAPTEYLLSPHDRQRIQMREGVKNVGLLQSSAHLAPVEADPARLAVDYVKHLEQHPLDTEAREKLAKIYAERFQRVDMGIGQLNYLVESPNQPGKNVARWLNLIADWQIQYSSDLDGARATLHRLIEKFPNAAAAENARRRLDLLKLSVKTNEKSQAVKLGSYEQDIGLKRSA